MNAKYLWIATAIALVSLAGCHKAESPSEVQHDVAEAAQEAEKNTTNALEDQADTVADANQEVTEEAQDAAVKTADSTADVAVTRAEGEHKIALEECEAMSGDQQKACKDKANAALEMAKANAAETRAAPK